MAKVFPFLISIILAIVNFIMPFLPNCEACDSTGYVVCDQCDGESFEYSPQLDCMVACVKCFGTGKVECSTCPENFRHIFLLNTELENYGQ